MAMNDFGNRLEYVIKTSDYKTGKEFCEKAEISTATLSRLRKGHTKPSYEFLVTLTVLIPDVDLKWLLTGKAQLSKDEIERQIELEVKAQVKKKVESALVKPSSNRINSQITQSAI
ncbi:helix-turn-helix domain-containing protein [Saccharicrinis aurantiacus]|uniref:helix-turn-helix domain-containing protein n=1 Tax=Saccharicrinis aurantiacus TaxID=1849719 RepID=UPI00094FC4FA|nr:helix-turn-helix domain-containing protein [Saccharicrinis aurantiacus]